MRHAILVVCVLACGHGVRHGPPASPPAAVSVVLAGPTVPAASLRVAATDSFGVTLARHLAPGATVRVAAGRAALDLIDSGADVFVTDQRIVVGYASRRSDLVAIPLAWDRQYVLVSADAVPWFRPYALLDAVNAEVRPAPGQCGSTDQRARRVVYMADDPIGRSLAERIVGVGTGSRAVPLRREAFDQALATTADGWYIVTRPAGDSTCGFGRLNATPLAETRSQLIVRRNAVGVVADSTGQTRLEITP